jgi:hypothetical protein
MIFEEKYSIFAERAAREIIAKKPKELKNVKREVEFLKYFVILLVLGIIIGGI